ncbi:UDP-N-acetylglucosamine diphosphorylase/glucosamine-1-phosphate N-acetyltransferase [bacterium A37T11]|nr:UDP-N-acetylglucosamine diphosphorylase/glucosamine-1-phosphate N-acetyltransferase [bacterium A37T11]
MDVVLFDDLSRISLYPLALTRPVADLRVGILTIAEKWEKWLQCSVSFSSADYLANKFLFRATDSEVLLINGAICPDQHLVNAITNLRMGEALMNEKLLAVRTSLTVARNFRLHSELRDHRILQYSHTLTQLYHPEDIFTFNGQQIRSDFELITRNRNSSELDGSNRIIGNNIFVEEGAKSTAATINTTYGPIYIGKNAEIWEGSLIRGPFALCEGAQLKMGTKIYNNVTVGPFSRVGGELNTCVIWGNSSKGHEGYFGSSVMGEWCNWGADTNNSNLKNNYKNVRFYDYAESNFRDTGLQFCGLIMGDHAKCAINTAFNTGTVVGVGASIFGSGTPPAYVPDFSWGGREGFTTYELTKFFETVSLVYERRNRIFDLNEQEILRAVFKLTLNRRNFKN